MSVRTASPVLFGSVLALIASPVFASPQKEMPEQTFLDQVEAPGHVLVTARGVEAVNAEARRQGLRFPAVGYWSPENICFKTPASGDCNGLFLHWISPTVPRFQVVCSSKSSSTGRVLIRLVLLILWW